MYHKKSYLDAKISSDVTFNDSKNKAYVTFHIEEGPAYRVNRLQYFGNEFLTEAELLEGLKLRQDLFLQRGLGRV